MRTYSHALLTFAATRRSKPNDSSFAAWAALGATLPDLPAGIGAARLWVRRRYSRESFLEEVCGRNVFSKPDAALHSVVPVTAALLLYAVFGAEGYKRRKAVFPLLLGWAGHVAADALTHGSDARPLLWPVSEWRFESPVSYRESGRYGRLFTFAEHAALLLVAARMIHRMPRGAPPG